MTQFVISLSIDELTFLSVDVIQEVDGVFHYTVADVAIITERQGNQSEGGTSRTQHKLRSVPKRKIRKIKLDFKRFSSAFRRRKNKTVCTPPSQPEEWSSWWRWSFQVWTPDPPCSLCDAGVPAWLAELLSLREGSHRSVNCKTTEDNQLFYTCSHFSSQLSSVSSTHNTGSSQHEVLLLFNCKKKMVKMAK